MRYSPKKDKEPDPKDKREGKEAEREPKADRFAALRHAARAVKPHAKDSSPAVMKARSGAAAMFGKGK